MEVKYLPQVLIFNNWFPTNPLFFVFSGGHITFFLLSDPQSCEQQPHDPAAMALGCSYLHALLTMMGCTLNCELNTRRKVPNTALVSSLSCWLLLSLGNLAELTFYRKLPCSYKAGLSTDPLHYHLASPALSPPLTAVVCNHYVCLLI